MTTPDPDYDSSLFADRQKKLATLTERLLDEEADKKRCRCIIVEGPGKCGKTWLLYRLQELLLQEAGRPLVLYLSSQNLTQSQLSRSELCKQLLSKPWDAAQQIVKDVAGYETSMLALMNSSQFAGASLGTVLNEFITTLAGLPQPIYFIIIFDGIEEVDSASLEEFEDLFIVPSFKYPNVRVVASRRESQGKPWKRFSLTKQTLSEPLEGFDVKQPSNASSEPEPAEEQVTKLIAKLNRERATTTQITWTLADLKAQLKYYRWTNPGANAQLVECATENNGIITQGCLEECLAILLNAPRSGMPLNQEDRVHLVRLIERFPDIEHGENVMNVGSVLGMSDRERNAFIGRVKARGIAAQPQQTGNMVFIPHEIAAIIRELQERG